MHSAAGCPIDTKVTIKLPAHLPIIDFILMEFERNRNEKQWLVHSLWRLRVRGLTENAGITSALAGSTKIRG
jgi:hypothetical protein